MEIRIESNWDMVWVGQPSWSKSDRMVRTAVRGTRSPLASFQVLARITLPVKKDRRPSRTRFACEFETCDFIRRQVLLQQFRKTLNFFFSS